jgi:DNA-directed RNA polymerase subunit RPC12/RpoP
VERVTLCVQCQRSFHDDEGHLHPTLDGIHCPHCGALNLFVAVPPSWETYQEMLLDEQWENHHHSEDDDFYAYYVE